MDLKDELRTPDSLQELGTLKMIQLVYEDLLQPSVRKLGRTLELMANRFYEKVKAKTESIPLENRTIPPIAQTREILQLGIANVDRPELQEIFANLLKTSVDKNSVQFAHPAFPSIIQRITPDEAIILRMIANQASMKMKGLSIFVYGDSGVSLGFKSGIREEFRYLPMPREQGSHSRSDLFYPELLPAYLDNLVRERLIIVDYPNSHNVSLKEMDREETFAFAADDGALRTLVTSYQLDPEEVFVQIVVFEMTALGKQFCRACVLES